MWVPWFDVLVKAKERIGNVYIVLDSVKVPRHWRNKMMEALQSWVYVVLLLANSPWVLLCVHLGCTSGSWN